MYPRIGNRKYNWLSELVTRIFTILCAAKLQEIIRGDEVSPSCLNIIYVYFFSWLTIYENRFCFRLPILGFILSFGINFLVKFSFGFGDRVPFAFGEGPIGCHESCHKLINEDEAILCKPFPFLSPPAFPSPQSVCIWLPKGGRV